MKWCCLTFKSWYEAASESGFAVLVGRSAIGKPEFILQYRVIDKGKENEVHSEHLISLVSEVRIQHCPWCGRNLEKWYGKYIDMLDRPDLKVSIPGLD